MPLRAVFLDVGDTLLHERTPRFAIYAEVARAHGAEVAPDAMRRLMRRAHETLPLELDGAYRYSDPWFRAFIRRIFADELGLAADAIPGITDELFRRFEHADTFELFPGALELIDALRTRGLVVGVISNWSARLPRVLRVMGLEERVDPVLCSALERLEKPDPALFRAALARAGVAPQEALHAGDHPLKDVAAAEAVGIEGVLVDHFGRGAELQGTRVENLAELRAYILGRHA